VSGRSAGDVENDVTKRLQHTRFPLEYHAEVIADPTGIEATATRLLILGALAAVGIFLLLQAAFGSWRLAALVFASLPLALVGGEIAALVAGGEVSIGALAGFLAVFAIAARQSVVLVTHYRRLQRDSGEQAGPALVMRGALERLAPVLMTTLATGLAVLPLVILGDRAGYEIVHPMAVVIAGGLVTSALLTLFVLPALYLRYGFVQRALTPELELLHRWAGVEPAVTDGAGAGVEAVLVDKNGGRRRPAEPEPTGGDARRGGNE
jgi:Cu/Ag efflux pump CusA